MTKIAGSGSESGSRSISQRHGSADPDPHQNVMVLEHWRKCSVLSYLFDLSQLGGCNGWVPRCVAVKMFELKSKNSQDQIGRLEEKEADMKKEYTKLHERHVTKKYFKHFEFWNFVPKTGIVFFRYTDLFKTHMDYMERSKVSQYKGVPFCYLAKFEFFAKVISFPLFELWKFAYFSIFLCDFVLIIPVLRGFRFLMWLDL
jgi:hypothetical protein